VHWSRLALRVVRGAAPYWSLSAQSGHWQALARNASVENDPLGFAVNPHRFRHAAASLWSIRDPVNVRGAKDLLGHASFRTTENFYVMSQSRVAGRALARAIVAKQRSN
jgi:integrase